MPRDYEDWLIIALVGCFPFICVCAGIAVIILAIKG